MPVWATVVVGVVAGLGGGLIGTLVKVSEDRKAEVRRRTIEATEDIAAVVTNWLALADAAVEEVAERGPEVFESRRVALDSIRDGRKRLDRLAILLGPGHVVVGSGARILHLLGEAVEGLPSEWPEANLDDEDEAHMATMATQEERDEYRADVEGELIDEEIAESRLMLRLALEGWDTFAEASSLYLQRGLLPRPRWLVALFRRSVNWFKYKRMQRRHKELLAKNPAMRELLARQRRASKRS